MPQRAEVVVSVEEREVLERWARRPSSAQALARFRPTLSHDDDEWELVVEGETEDDVPDLVSILRQRLADPDSSVSLLVNGEPRPVAPRPGI